MNLQPDRYPSFKQAAKYRDFLFRHKEHGTERRLRWFFHAVTNIFILDDEVFLVEGIKEASSCFLDYALGLQLDGYKIQDNVVEEIWQRPT